MDQRKDTQRTGADDSDMIDEMTQAQTIGGSGSGQGSSGGALAREVGSRDELEQVDEDSGVTRATKADKIQPATNTRSDNDGARDEKREPGPTFQNSDA